MKYIINIGLENTDDISDNVIYLILAWSKIKSDDWNMSGIPFVCYSKKMAQAIVDHKNKECPKYHSYTVEPKIVTDAYDEKNFIEYES